MEVTQEEVDAWREQLIDFEDVFERIFKPAKIGRDAALIVWVANKNTNLVCSELEELVELIDDKFNL